MTGSALTSTEGATLGAGDLGRIASLETHLGYLATNADIEHVKGLVKDNATEISKSETRLLKQINHHHWWLTGALITAGASVIASLIISLVRLVP